mmetsp:Transcript_78579/g.202381  ORF Transcript_78579/g.202381 Transcript_78579/m.202381 type:complete len:227 (-) Transcript_78579:444-1124(-)
MHLLASGGSSKFTKAYPTFQFVELSIGRYTKSYLPWKPNSSSSCIKRLRSYLFGTFRTMSVVTWCPAPPPPAADQACRLRRLGTWTWRRPAPRAGDLPCRGQSPRCGTLDPTSEPWSKFQFIREVSSPSQPASDGEPENQPLLPSKELSPTSHQAPQSGSQTKLDPIACWSPNPSENSMGCESPEKANPPSTTLYMQAPLISPSMNMLPVPPTSASLIMSQELPPP